MNVWSGEIHSRVRACWKLFKIFSKVLCDTFWHFYVMIIRKNTPLYGAEACLLRPESTPMCSAVHSGRGSRAFYGQKARLCARGHALT